MKNLKRLLWFVMVLSVSRAAIAHTGLVSSSPEDGAMLSEAPAALTLTFGEPVRLMKLRLLDKNNQPHETGFSPVMKARKTFEVSLSALPGSRYTVTWMAMGGDSHKIDGQFQFHVHGAGDDHSHH